MAVVALSQVFLASMLLGVEFFGSRIGSSPFILLRDAVPGPIFQRADYLNYVKDGNGLNPLLQNYWMVIHPPTLMLGFAAMIVPFAYGIAGLWQKRFADWIKPAIPWSLFACMILGTGIIMGSFWAYEALNFGGFWAWDPVENGSIIPWLTLIAGVHVLIVFKNTGHSFFTAIFLVLISFVLVLYASYLTKSGVLGETSVHAFTDLGMNAQHVIYMFVFLIISVWLIVLRWKELPITKKDEETYSREFWMFVGAIFLVLSCFHLTVVTSIPVWNKLFGTDIAPPTNPVKHYNTIQAAFAVVITLLTAVTQFLKYKKTDPKRFAITSLVYLVVSALLTLGVVFLTGINDTNIIFALVTFGGIYTLMANARVLSEALKGKWKLAGSAVAHIGFGLLLVGALIAAATNKVVSINNTGIGFGAEFEKNNNKSEENILLYKNEPVKMDKYTVTYLTDSVVLPNHYYKVNYKVVDDKGKVSENFNLYPTAQLNPKMGLVASPDTRHYLFHDVYTHVSMAPIKDASEAAEEEHAHGAAADEDKSYDPPKTEDVKIGDTVRYKSGFIVLKALNKNARLQNMPLAKSDVAVGATLEITQLDGKKFTAEPVFLIKGQNRYDFAKNVDEANLKLRFANILPEAGKIQLMVYEKKQAEKAYIVMKAIQFPYINFFWAGTVIMIVGFLMSIR
ncbi:MAG: cytochrome c biogenesis protein CcsA, partial [Mucilaginibacter polytrichastri]|nr:cytochrome c biogenesis protein CcsA [Mucilaginibacter polytrichastri]